MNKKEIKKEEKKENVLKKNNQNKSNPNNLLKYSFYSLIVLILAIIVGLLFFKKCYYSANKNTTNINITKRHKKVIKVIQKKVLIKRKKTKKQLIKQNTQLIKQKTQNNKKNKKQIIKALQNKKNISSNIRNNTKNKTKTIKKSNIKRKKIKIVKIVKSLFYQDPKKLSHQIPKKLLSIKRQELTMLYNNRCKSNTIFFTNKYRKKQSYIINNNNTLINTSKLIINTVSKFVTYAIYFNSYNAIEDIFKYNNLTKVTNNIYYPNINIRFKFSKKKFNSFYSKHINKNQRIYFFPLHNDILFKPNLAKFCQQMQKRFPKLFNYLPETYILPNDKEKFKQNFNKSDKLWLYKPKYSCCGKGIYIINDTNIKEKEGIATEFIKNPHLIDGRKYHIRVYALVSSYSPMKVYIYNGGGIINFASEKYNMSDINNPFVHNTNQNINKHNPKYKNFSEYEKDCDIIWTPKKMKKIFKKFGNIWKKIKDMFEKTFISITEEISKDEKYMNEYNFQSFFKLFAADIIIDENYKPWLLEMNYQPNLACANKDEYFIKTNMWTDILNVIGVKPYDHSLDKKNIDIIQRKNVIDELINESLCEFERPSGNLERIFPLKEKIHIYKKLIKKPGKINQKLWEKMLKS